MAATGRDPATLLCAQLEAIFCPALDPALVAAIAYEPNQSFDQATQILSQLVPEEEPWEQSQPTTAAPATSSPSASTSSSPALNQSASPKDTDQIPASDPISETQLHDLLDQWEAQGTIIIPADDDPVLNLTDEESDPLHRQQLSSPPPPQQDSPKSPHESTSRSPASPPPTATTDEQQQRNDESTLPFLVHAFPRLPPSLLSSILASNDGNLTTTLDELITAQLIADDPGLLQAPTAVVEERTKKEAAGLDLDKLAHGTRALRLDGAKKKRRKGDDAMGGGGMARTRSAGPLVRLGDVRQGGGANDGNTSAPSEAMRRKLKDAIDAGWKDPKDRLAVAIPAHLLQHTSSSSSSSNASTTSLPSSPFLSSTFDVASDGDVEEERRRAIDDALLTQVDMRKIASIGHRDQSSAHDQNTPLAETSTWLLTSSVLSQLIHLLRPIPFSSPTSAAVERRKKRKRNPPLFSETEANAVHARSSFHLPRTLSRLIGRSAEVYDSYNRSLLKASTEGGVDGDGEWAKEKAIAAAFDLDELALTIAALAGIEAGSTDNRAKMALTATGGRSEEGGDPDAALDLLELWNGVESQFGAAGAGVGMWDGEEKREEEEKPWTEVVKPIRRSAVRQFLETEEAAAKKKRGGNQIVTEEVHGDDHDAEDEEDDSDEGEEEEEERSSIIDVYALPTLAQAARIASTRKAAQALSAQRRTIQTAASVLKRDPVLGLSPAAAAQQARDAIARERLAHARRGAAIVLPASATAIGFGDDDFGAEDEGEDGVMSLGARRRRALERLDYASRMETEYREKRRDALRKASSAWRGISSSSSSAYPTAVLPLGMPRDRAEVPGSATYFGLPEARPKFPTTPNTNGFSTPVPPSIPSSAASLAPRSTKALRGSAAWYYADEARRLDAKARSWGLKAAQALVEERKLAHAASASLPSSSYSVGVRKAERNVIDLHLLTTGEALAVVKEEIDKWWWSTPRGAASTLTSGFTPAPASSSSSTPRTTASSASAGGYGFRPLPAPYVGFGPGPLHIITGIGKHSRGNVAVLRPAVCGWLKRGGWDYEEDAPRGRIVVKGFKGRSSAA